MRNLLEYPVARDDVLFALRDAIRVCDGQQYIGDIRGLALKALEDFLRDHAEIVDLYLTTWDPFSTVVLNQPTSTSL